MQTVLNSILQELPRADSGAPEWVHLLPAGTFSGADGRGPFELGDAGELIAASLKPGRKLPIDVNHAIDLQAKDGKESPAAGWIVALENRADGIWGRVEWTAVGRYRVIEKDYGYLSPVFTHPKTGPKRVTQLLRAALTNDPNLTLTALHHRNHEENETMEKQMREALGLPETASQAEILAAAKERVAKLKEATDSLAESKQEMSRIAKAVGLAEGSGEKEIVKALNARSQADPAKSALEDQIKALNTRLTEVTTQSAKKDAVAAIDGAIGDGKIVPALRDHFIARHMKDPAEVEKEIKAMPSLNSGGLGHRRQDADPATAALSDADAQVVHLMGLDPKQFAETAKQEREAH